MRIVRTLALSGTAAVALLSGAGAASAATTDDPAAVTAEAVRQASGAPVALPSGRTMSVTGMDSAAYRASGDQRDAVVQLAAAGDGTDDGPTGVGSGNVPAGQPAAPQQPGVPQQQYQPGVHTQASAGSISMTAAIGVGLLIAVILAVRSRKVQVVWAVLCIALGVYLTPTFVGPLVQQLGGSVGGSLGNVWNGL